MLIKVNPRLLEQEVLEVIKGSLAKDEKIEVGGSKGFDFFLPNGLKKMHWPHNTYIEVKYKLIFNSLERIVNQYKEKSVSKLIVVVVDEESAFFYRKYAAKYELEIKSLNDIKKELDWLGNNELSKEKSKIYKEIWKLAKNKVQHNTISLFLGAGVSASSGVVTWDSLLEQLCIKKGIAKIDSDIDSTIKGRFIIDKYKENGKITDAFYDDMKDILYSKNNEASKLIQSIANIAKKENVESVVTYNYDDLLEQYIKSNCSRSCSSIYGNSRLENEGDLPVYHVHGYIPKIGDSSKIVLGEREYHEIYQDAYDWGNVEQLHALTRNTCIFIGLSMKDPNLRRLLDISVQQDSEHEAVHFAFLRRIEYDVPFMETNMREFGINCIWYDNHSDLPQMLEDLI